MSDSRALPRRPVAGSSREKRLPRVFLCPPVAQYSVSRQAERYNRGDNLRRKLAHVLRRWGRSLTPTILFVHQDVGRLDYETASYHWLAGEAGFRAFAATWRDIGPSERGTFLRSGYQAVDRHRKRSVAPGEIVQPQIVVHRKLLWGLSMALIKRLRERHPTALFSYHPTWTAACQKWNMELCFREAERQGIRVARPVTYLVEKRYFSTRLRSAGHARPLIFKPAGASHCDGILISTPQSFESVAAEAAQSRYRRYVVQELVENPVLYKGTKFDLRVYAMLISLDPLRYRVYHEGVVRLAAERYDQALQDQPVRALTGCSYRKKLGLPIENLSVSELLECLRGKGYDVDDFWSRIGALFESVFLSFRCLPRTEGAGLSDSFYFAGADVLLAERDRRIEPLFLETNEVPQMTDWGADVDSRLQTAYRDWVGDLKELCPW